MQLPRGNRWLRLVPVAVMLTLVVTTLPGLAAHANPQHFDAARAMLNGSLWITDPTTTHDLGRAGARWYAPFPPLPALVAAGALLAGADPDTVYGSAVLAAALGAVLLSWTVGVRLGGPAAGAWAAVALGLGSGLWTATVLHDTYHSAHVLAVLGVTGALAAVVAHRPQWWLAGTLIGLAALARQPVILGTPFLLLLARPAARPGRYRAALALLAGAAIPFGAYLALNAARFGSPFETGYAAANHAPRIASDVALHGAFSLDYLLRNLRTMLAATPRLLPTFPFVLPDPQGLSLILVSPWLLLAIPPLLAPDRPPARRAAAGCMLAACAIAVPHLLYVNTGWMQFGYRFALDETPILLVAAVFSARRAHGRLAWLAVAWATATHAWGFVLLWNWDRWGRLIPG